MVTLGERVVQTAFVSNQQTSGLVASATNTSVVKQRLNPVTPSPPDFPRAGRIAVGSALFFAVVGTLAAFIDLPLSVAVVNPASGWGTFLADWGELPGYLVAIAGVMVLFRHNTARVREVPILSVAAILGLLLLAVYGLGRIVDYVLPEASTALLLTIGVVLGILLFAASFLVGPRAVRELFPVSRNTVLLALLHPILIVQLGKLLWGRVRFRHLAPGFADFTPWYLPQGITGHESFPSGHAAMGWMLLPIAFYLTLRFLAARAGSQVRAPGKLALALVWGTVVLFGVAVAASRVVVGPHYLSDVAFSTAVAWALTGLLASRHNPPTKV